MSASESNTGMYQNGPGSVPRLPASVVDALINDSGVSRCAPSAGLLVRDETAAVQRLVHSACEELLARIDFPDGSSSSSISAPSRSVDSSEFETLLFAYRDTKFITGQMRDIIAHVDNWHQELMRDSIKRIRNLEHALGNQTQEVGLLTLALEQANKRISIADARIEELEAEAQRTTVSNPDREQASSVVARPSAVELNIKLIDHIGPERK